MQPCQFSLGEISARRLVAPASGSLGVREKRLGGIHQELAEEPARPLCTPLWGFAFPSAVWTSAAAPAARDARRLEVWVNVLWETIETGFSHDE
jgi:hypothetical protein